MAALVWQRQLDNRKRWSSGRVNNLYLVSGPPSVPSSNQEIRGNPAFDFSFFYCNYTMFERETWGTFSGAGIKATFCVMRPLGFPCKRLEIRIFADPFQTCLYRITFIFQALLSLSINEAWTVRNCCFSKKIKIINLQWLNFLILNVE